MKFFKNKLHISKRELSSIVAFSFSIFILSFYRLVLFLKEELMVAVENGFQLSNFDILFSFQSTGIIDAYSFTFVIIPIFVLLVLFSIDYNNKTIRLIRYKNRKNLWNKNTAMILTSALLLSLLLVLGGYLVSGVILNGYNNTWNTEKGLPYLLYGTSKIWKNLSELLVSYKVLFIFGVTTFLGLSFVGLLVSTLKMLIHNIYVFFIIMAVLIIDIFGVFKFKILLGIAVSPIAWLHHDKILLYNIYFFVGAFVLYFIGRYINSTKDQGIVKAFFKGGVSS